MSRVRRRMYEEALANVAVPQKTQTATPETDAARAALDKAYAEGSDDELAAASCAFREAWWSMTPPVHPSSLPEPEPKLD